MEFHHANHNHWHFEDFARYDLLDADKNYVARSRKQSFCLANTDAVDYTVPGADWQPENTDLATACGDQGALSIREVLAAGSGDTYAQYRAGQAFKIGDLPNGVYYIRVEGNPSATSPSPTPPTTWPTGGSASAARGASRWVKVSALGDIVEPEPTPDRMSRTTRVVVALATAAAVLSGSTAGARRPRPSAASPAELPREIPGGIELTLADGDLLGSGPRTATAPCWASAATPRRAPGGRGPVSCGARTSSAATSMRVRRPVRSRSLAQCDRLATPRTRRRSLAARLVAPTASPGRRTRWTARPTRSRASPPTARTRSGRSPRRYVVCGPPAASPSTSWTRTAGVHRRRRRSPTTRRSRSSTAPSRRQQVRPRRPDAHRRCRTDAPGLPLADACSDSNFANVDADTAWFGDASPAPARSSICRVDARSPWAVTAIAPASRPGLARGTSGGLFTRLLQRARRARSSPSGRCRRRPVRAQLYDRLARPGVRPRSSMTPAGQVQLGRQLDRRAAHGRSPSTSGAAARHVVLTTPDAVSWHALRMGKYPVGLSPDGRYVAVPAPQPDARHLRRSAAS